VFHQSLAHSHFNLGEALCQAGRLTESELELRKAIPIYQKLADDNPKVPDYRSSLALGHTNLAIVLRRLGRNTEARDHSDRAIGLGEALLKGVAATAINRSRLARSYRRRSPTRRDLGDPSGAAADARRALELYDGLPSPSGRDWFESACCHAALAGLAGSGVPAAVVPSEADTAMSLLHKAVSADPRAADTIRNDDALEVLRDRLDFRVFMMDLAMPAKPFAPAR
jgi:eukaryotic-like serine/threonine-protein kinase